MSLSTTRAKPASLYRASDAPKRTAKLNCVDRVLSDRLRRAPCSTRAVRAVATDMRANHSLLLLVPITLGFGLCLGLLVIGLGHIAARTLLCSRQRFAFFLRNFVVAFGLGYGNIVLRLGIRPFLRAAG